MSWQKPYQASSVDLSSQCKFSFPRCVGRVTALPQETGGRDWRELLGLGHV